MAMRSARFWAVFLSIAIIGTITWLAIFEHNYHPRIYRLNEDLPERSASSGRMRGRT